eukprot:3082886-Amphidinium_carterae.1
MQRSAPRRQHPLIESCSACVVPPVALPALVMLQGHRVSCVGNFSNIEDENKWIIDVYERRGVYKLIYGPMARSMSRRVIPLFISRLEGKRNTRRDCTRSAQISSAAKQIAPDGCLPPLYR